MTAAEVRAALRSIAFELVRLEERGQEVLDSVPRSEDEAVMFKGRIPWDLPTELRATIECLREEEIRRPVIESLVRVCQVTADGLLREFRPGRN